MSINRSRFDPDKTGSSPGRDNAAVMTAYPLSLDSPLLGSERSPQELSEARGVLSGAVLGGLVWAVVLYVLHVV